MDIDRLTFDYADAQRFRDAAGASRARRLRRSGAIPHPHALRHRPDQSRPLLRSLPHHRGRARLAYRARAQSDLVGRDALFPPHRGLDDREHARRSKPISSPAASTWWRARSGFSLDQALAFEKRHGDAFAMHLQARPHLRACRPQSRQSDPRRPARAPGAALCASTARRSATSSSPAAIRSPTASCRRSTGSTIADVPHYPYDPAKARALLDAAGWHADGKAVRRNAAGEPLSLELADHRRRPHPRAGRGSAAKPVAPGRHRRAAQEPAGARPVRRDRHPAQVRRWRCSPGSARPRTCRARCCDSDEIPSAANGWTGENYTGFRNAEADRLIDAIEVELDRDRRAALWHQLQTLYAEELPALPLYFRAEAYRAAANGSRA